MALYSAKTWVDISSYNSWFGFSAQITIEDWNITKTCPCNVYPLEHHFYIAKLGYAGVFLFFLFLLQNIDCGYSLEPPRRRVPTIYILSKNKKNIIIFSAENFQFLNLKKSLFIAWEIFRNALLDYLTAHLRDI